MSFGKRQSGVGAQVLNVDATVAQSQAGTETDRPAGGPIRWIVVLLACCAMLYGLFASYGPDIVRDHRLSGTWQPAYDLQAMDGKCKRTNFVVTFCTAKIRSVAMPNQAPIEHSFMMLFSGGGGEAMVPRFVVTVVRMAVSARRRPVVSGLRSMIGAGGEMLEDATETGWASINGETWRVRVDAPVVKGRRIRVVGMNGNVPLVELGEER